jgi:hypothetical protein
MISLARDAKKYRAFAVGLSAILAGCVGQPVAPNAPSPSAASRVTQSSGDLLYLTDGAGTVTVYSYPAGKLVQTLASWPHSSVRTRRATCS